MNDSTSTPTLSPEQLAQIVAEAERQALRLAAFTTTKALKTPVALLGKFTRTEWERLTPAQRAASLIQTLTEQRTANFYETMNRKATAPPTATAPAVPVSAPVPVPTARYVVSCAGLCGRMLPARGPRPVLAWCARRSDGRRDKRTTSCLGPERAASNG